LPEEYFEGESDAWRSSRGVIQVWLKSIEIV
jgi:hypothetical protein